MTLDLTTLTVMTALGCLVLPAMTWVALMSRRDRVLDLWCLGGWVVGLGWLLASLRGHVSDWWSLALGFVLLVGSLAIRVQALRRMLQLPSQAALLTVLVLACGALFALTQWTGDHHQRGLLARIAFAVGSFAVAWYAWQVARQERSPPMRWIAAAFAVMGAGFTDLAVASLMNPSAPRALGWSNYWTFTLTTSMFTNILSHFGFATLLLEREKQQQVAMQRQAVAEAASRQLGQQLAQVERKRDLALVGSALIHDLSQPLAALLVHAEVTQRGLKIGRLAPEKVVLALQKIEASAQRCDDILHRTMEDLRDTREPSRPVLLAELVRQSWELLERQAERFGITWRLQAEPALWVHGDPTQLSQILVNLLRNAIDALENHPGPRDITARIVPVDDVVVLKVQDNGPGIPPEVRTRLFEPFLTTKPNGLGLGLPICLTLARRMGGQLSVSPLLQGGTMFTLELPRATAPAIATAP